MTKRRPITTRRLNTDGFPSLEAVAEMDYDELVETWCFVHDAVAAVAPGKSPGGIWSPRAMTKRLEQLATDDPSLVARVAKVLAHERQATPNGAGDLVFAEQALALAAVRASMRLLTDGVTHIGPFRNVRISAGSAPPARQRPKPTTPPSPQHPPAHHPGDPAA